jgi:membrane protein DedA with SNARE-associated domain
VIVVLTGIELAGTLMLHGIARSGGVRVLDRVGRGRQSQVQTTFDHWRGRLGGHDAAAIAVLRLIPFVRMGVTVGSGLLRIRLRDFMVGSAIAAIIWTALPLALGYAFHSSVEEIEGYYGSVVDALPALLGLAILIVGLGTIGTSAATLVRLRAMVSPVRTGSTVRSRPASLPEIRQETPPGLG